MAHQYWHIDVSYINIRGTFYYLCSMLDGCSRYIVNWDLRESMTEADIEIILERAKELHPEAKPRIISDKSLKGECIPAGNATVAGRCTASGGITTTCG